MRLFEGDTEVAIGILNKLSDKPVAYMGQRWGRRWVTFIWAAQVVTVVVELHPDLQ